MPSWWHRVSSATNDAIERSVSAGSGEARLMRYESCDTTPFSPLASYASRNAAIVPGSSTGSRHWLGVLVKSWMAVAPISTTPARRRLHAALGGDVGTEAFAGPGRRVLLRGWMGLMHGSTDSP